MKPGEVYFIDLPEAGRHPIIVVSREKLNRGDQVLAVPLTSKSFAERSTYRNCVPFRAGDFGMTRDCVARCEAAGAFLKEYIDLEHGPIATVSDEVLRSIIRAIGYAIEADCEPE